jgi:hypothetical protein
VRAWGLEGVPLLVGPNFVVNHSKLSLQLLLARSLYQLLFLFSVPTVFRRRLSLLIDEILIARLLTAFESDASLMVRTFRIHAHLSCLIVEVVIGALMMM